MGKIFGYARVSAKYLNLDIQINGLKKAVSSGDTIVVYKLVRISRSIKDLTEYFEQENIQFISL